MYKDTKDKIKGIPLNKIQNKKYALFHHPYVNIIIILMIVF